MFSDIYKIWEVADGLCLEVEGKMVSRTEGNIDDSLIGGNASAEGPEGEDIIINVKTQVVSSGQDKLTDTQAIENYKPGTS
ncbi:hypothetical protein G4228_009753 [Cervus hanglu yarkandensis]|nr:hypothetical protein G4228_009753 [Cervus hanglu yarkandensis]